MRAGDAFRFLRIAEKHVWTIISDPEINPGKVLMVNFTSNAPHLDQCCLICQGEHPFITTETVVNFARAKSVTDSALEQLRNSGRLQMIDPLSAALLAKIRASAMVSTTLALELADILIEQELI